MKLGARSSLAEVAVAVGDSLRRAGIRAVLTGGACANLYSGGAYPSVDVDFVIAGPCAIEDLDRALAGLGFKRDRARYIHGLTTFFVEFPSGPLGIGEDVGIRPVLTGRRAAKTLALSATDACRDRLAAFYHWNDRQALGAAVAVAFRHRIAFAKVREWSRLEGHLRPYNEFLAELRRARKAGRGRTLIRRSRPKR